MGDIDYCCVPLLQTVITDIEYSFLGVWRYGYNHFIVICIHYIV